MTTPEDDLTIPQIMRGLSSLSDRHALQLRIVRDEMREVIGRKDQQIAEYDRQIQNREDRIAAMMSVLDDLDNRLMAIRLRAKRNLGFAVDTDSSALLELLGPEVEVGQEVRERMRDIRAKRRAEAERAAEETSLDDICNCGHRRSSHTPRPGVDWAEPQCDACPGDSERSWRHPFTMAVL